MTEIEGYPNRKCLSSRSAYLAYSHVVSSEVGRRICPGSASPIAISRSRNRQLSFSGGAE